MKMWNPSKKLIQDCIDEGHINLGQKYARERAWTLYALTDRARQLAYRRTESKREGAWDSQSIRGNRYKKLTTEYWYYNKLGQIEL